ncbi:flagellinolysin [Acetobacterium woodii]|uniref:Flagellin n=1 Tax=Acetobacterium woodii (strain ATCC 29683 / DSM 1030 / JCM 2381 / KCTC 1655 / WB1) TaxID=931626 RepID=H6LB94_ACEWD|nr:flagellinolysin [Acetobacterium woodii]AFA47646.1 flagellin [Acetobacterium woodii DSM 1030]
MRINHNIAALNTYQKMSSNSNQVSKSLEKLSSGQCINRAGDNAAGLAISEKMRGQIRGLDQAGANAQDGIALIQTAEGALNETHSLIQRIRELSVQAANDTNVVADRESIQSEINQLTKEVDRIGNDTEFNTKKLLNQGNASMDISDQQNLISSLKKWWLSDAETLVTNSYGLTASGIDMAVEFVNDSSSSYAAMVVGSFTSVPGDTVGKSDITGKGSNLTLKINMAYSQPTDTEDGGTYPQYVDRVIAHEITHAVMMTTMNFGDLSTWFTEGVAEFTHGGDERLESAITSLGSIEAVRDNIGTGSEADWNGNSNDYGTGYLAVRYLDKQIRLNGGTGIKEVTTYLAAHSTENLDDALVAMKAAHSGLSFNSSATMIAQFKANVNTGNLTATTGIVLTAGAEVDTGSATGSEAAGGAAKTAETIMAETPGDPEVDQPMTGFNITWPNLADAVAQSFSIQVGANTGQTMAIQTSDMRVAALGIDSLKVDSNTSANAAISSCDSAINMVSAERSRLGAYQNRLEHTIKNLQTSSENLVSSESRIRDVDMAKEMMNFTKNNILQQAAQSMLAQANQQPQSVLQLLA